MMPRGGCIPPWRTKLSSYSAIVQIKGYRVCAIVWCFIHTVSVMCFGARVAVMDVTASEDDAITMAVLSHLGAVNQNALSGCLRCGSGRGLGLFE